MIDFDSLTLGEVKRIRELFETPDRDSRCDLFVGKYCVIRTYTAGVHVGVVRSRNGKEVVLSEAKRVWYWQGANTLHEIATKGIEKTSKVSDPVASILLTEATEFIPCTADAEAVLRGAKWAK